MSGPILVTGGTGALGRAVVAVLLDDGLEVRSTWVVERERAEVEAELGNDDRLGLIEADLSTVEGAQEAVARATAGRALGGLVALVGGFAAPGPLHENAPGDFERMVELNLMTAQRTIAAAIPPLLAGGGGSIVTVGARAALEPFAGAAAYIASKAAVIGLARAVAEDYREGGIRANAILPSVIDTPANREQMPDADHSSWVGPDEIARVIRFLLSTDSAPISGAAIPVYGNA
jgi:NAD(P)-dependent dehydrogenase (short-subunit alcohol dehydrogenase family)